MKRAAELEWIRRYLAHLSEGTTQLAPAPRAVAAAIYTGETRLAAETALVRTRPSLVALSTELPQAGSHLAVDVGGIPLLLMRHGDGRVRAFVNACRHRGSPLASEHGCAEGGLLRCPFHAWTYTTDGRLHATPNSAGGFEALDRSTLALHERPCAEAHGLVLARAQGSDPVDPVATLHGVRDDLRALDLDRYQHFETRTTTWRCNWKLVLETFLESYHVFSLHRETVHPWYASHPMLYDGFDVNLRFVVARRTLAELRDRPEADWQLADHATIQWLVAPNSLLTYTRDYVLLWRFFSPEPSRCEIRTSLYSEHPVRDDRDRKRLREAFDLQLRVTGDEDFPAQERIQRALDSGAIPENLFGANEVAAIHFHDALDGMLGPFGGTD